MLKNSVKKVAPNAQNGGPRVPKVVKRDKNGAKSGPKTTKKRFVRPGVRYAIYCTKSMLGGPGRGPKETKMQCRFQNPPERGPEARVWSKGVQKGRKWEPKGPQVGAKSVKKGVPITRPHSYGTLWAPIGAQGPFWMDLGLIFGRC